MSAYRRSTSINSQRSGSSIYRRQMSRDVSGSVRLGSIRRQTSRGNLSFKLTIEMIHLFIISEIIALVIIISMNQNNYYNIRKTLKF